MTAETEVFHKLTSVALQDLAREVLAGTLAKGGSNHALQQLVGKTLAPQLADSLAALQSKGWTNEQVSELLQTMVATRARVGNLETLFDIVLTGPDVWGVPTRDTAAVTHSLIQEARQEVLLVGYAVHNGRQLFETLANRMQILPQLRVDFLLNIPRRFKDTSLDSEIVNRFASEFAVKHWPWRPKPHLFYDPRALAADAAARASLHAKCIVVDRTTALITSANFTEYAQERNVEAGVLTSYEPFVQRISDYFLGLRENFLKPCLLPE